MELSIMTVSFPVDFDTAEEIYHLVTTTELEDKFSYEQVLNLYAITDDATKGFAVLAYVGEELVGLISAIDMIGIHSYEWSGLVLPDFRRRGVGKALLKALSRNLEARGAESELAVAVKNAPHAKVFLDAERYEWNFSEATLQANAIEEVAERKVEVKPLSDEHESLTRILMDAFEDTEGEVQTLMTFNQSDPRRHVFVANKDGETVGTVTVVEGEDTLWVTALATSPELQGQGIGSSILRFVLGEAGRRGVKTVMLDVEVDNDKALSLYEKVGFSPVMQVDYYVKSSATI
ncbi:MAG: GNAT family N-acetyltransferase [Paenisporosarcina sp.]